MSGNSYLLIVSVPRAAPSYARESNGAVDFGYGAIKAGAVHFGSPGAKLSVYQYRISAADMEQGRSAATVTLRSSDGNRYSFALSDMPAVLDSLRACSADLQKYWNLDGGPAIRSAEEPIGDIHAMFSSSDFPTDALSKQMQNTARYQLLVDEKGAVASCDVLVSSGAAVLDSTGCQLIKQKAKFRPAMDSSGKAVRSVWTSPPVTWRTTNEEAFNNGCRWVTGNGASVDSCMQGESQRMEPMTNQSAPPAPPSSPPSSGGTGH